MVFFQTKNPKLGKFGIPLELKRLMYILGGHLEHITAIWYISWQFGNLVAVWYISPRFGILCKEKSGNPVRNNWRQRRN
jgi:hypothetical protein